MRNVSKNQKSNNVGMKTGVTAFSPIGNVKLKVYETSNYNIFKFLLGNRKDYEKRSIVLKKSIERFQYLWNPVLINEKYEIIDGQARYIACKDLGIPIMYIMQPGIGIDECRALNNYTNSWKNSDYIDSFAEYKNTNYMYLRNLLNAYTKKGVPKKVIYYAATGKLSPNKVIKNGKIALDEEKYIQAVKALDYCLEFKEKFTYDKHDNYYLLVALCWMTNCGIAFDKDKMRKRLLNVKEGVNIYACNMESGIKILEDLYNKYMSEDQKTRFFAFYLEEKNMKAIKKAEERKAAKVNK